MPSTFAPGDRIKLTTPGGGYGNPAERDRLGEACIDESR